ncbi:MAG TPA: YCF48-related protein [Verrucomicrobiae bacterium]|nr:YCF48-related protein [Verrucomicrobiae bacterium]
MMRHVVLRDFVLLLMLCFLSSAAAQTPVWTQFPGAPGATSPRFDDLSFIDETNGWVARATGGIHKTADGGKTFTLSRSSTASYPGTNLTAHFRSICFVSPLRGWAGNLGPGSYDASVTDTNILFETFDGGTNWFVKPGFPETGMRGLCALYALDSQHIYGGGRVRGPACFIKSTDGGTNWSVTNLTTAGILGGIMDVYFKDANTGFLVGMDTNAYNSCAAPYYHGAIARTTNGGATWQVVAASGVNCAYFWKMSWPSPNVGYVSLQQNSMTSSGNHIFYKTTDGGATWSSNGVPFSAIGVSTFYSQGIGFVNETEGWVGGDSGAGTANYLHTTDGGQSWTRVGSEDTLRINRIRFLRSDYAVAAGARVAVYRVPLSITTQPNDQTTAIGSNATFSISAQGSVGLSYQWRHYGTNLPGANANAYTITHVQPADTGPYDVVVSDISGSLPSVSANLSVTPVEALFRDDFNSATSIVTTPGATNGYAIAFNATTNPTDFTAIFGFDYSTVNFPIQIPSAPHSTSSQTKGLYLTANKDTNGAISVVNLYPLGQSFAGNYTLKFDLWLNWANGASSTEHALFGINHSGNVINRPGLAPSDGLFFAISADGGITATSGNLRDYSVFQGQGDGLVPVLLTTNNTTFGPAPLLGPRFDASDPGFVNLFPVRAIPFWGNTPAGSAGLQWLSVEVRQLNQRITWLLNGALVAQYTNTTAYTSGNLMLGYLDFVNSIGSTDSFAVFDNVRVERLAVTPVELFSPMVVSNEFRFSFTTEPYETYTVQRATTLSPPNWETYTNVAGAGSPQLITVPLPAEANSQQYFRVSRP